MTFPFRLDRRRRAGRFLEWKVALFSVGAVLGLAGMLLERLWMTWVAMGFLGAGMVLRLMTSRRGDVDAEEPQE